MKDGELELVRTETMRRREAHDMGMGPEEGWLWMKVEFPKGVSVMRYARGMQFQGRHFHLASASKGSHTAPAVAWAASPPGNAGEAALEEALGWGSRFQLQPPSSKRPFPRFTLRARVKQLFSSSRPVDLSIGGFRVATVADVIDDAKQDRTDGSAEADPQLLSEAARQLLGQEPQDLFPGLHRRVREDVQIRCGGLKGTSSSVPRLLGTRTLEAPESMQKFPGTGPSLRVVSFSVVRPAALSLNEVLRLQALGVPQAAFVNAQQAHLEKLERPLNTRAALRLLGIDDEDLAAVAEGWGSLSRDGSSYLGSFAELLLAGFDTKQQPLLKILTKRRRQAIRAAAKSLRVSGVWSCRGKPEPKSKDGSRQLNGYQFFMMVPDVDGTNRVLAGPKLVFQSVDLDPGAVRYAEFVDKPELREKCIPGLLYFSVSGPAPQENLGWDFDGDFYKVVDNPELLPADVEKCRPGRWQPALSSETPSSTGQIPQPGVLMQQPRLADVVADFLDEFPSVDHMGLLHFHWQLQAGCGPEAAASDTSRRLAASYAMAVDVEKGGPRPPKPRREAMKQKWDFMKGSGPEAPHSPTAAGEIHRMAMAATAAISARAEACSELRPDPDLLAAWTDVEQRMGHSNSEALIQLARKVRSDLVEKVKLNMARAEHESEENPDTQCMSEERDDVFRAWLKEKLAETARAAASVGGATLAEVALAGWYWKYVKSPKPAAYEPGDRDPDQFPWTIFCAELCEAKQRSRKPPRCNLPQMERHRRLLLDVQRNVEAASATPGFETAWQRLEADYGRMTCHECARLRRWPEGCPPAAQLAEDFNLMRKGRKEMVPLNELRYAKSVIDETFNNGPQAGETVRTLIQRLRCPSTGHAVLASMCLVAVRFHGRLFVVEGNKRLWALRQAGCPAVRVDIQDMHLGLVHGEPALRRFFDKYTTEDEGKSVKVQMDQDVPQEALSGPSARRAGGSHPLEAVETVDCLPEKRSPEADARVGLSGRFDRDSESAHAAHEALTSMQPLGFATPPRSAPQADPCSLDSKVLSFGKYKGLTYRQVQDKEPGYCAWVLKEVKPTSQSDFRAFASFLQGRGGN